MIQTEILNGITKKNTRSNTRSFCCCNGFCTRKQQISGKIVDAQNNTVHYASISFSNKTVKENAAFLAMLL